MTVLVCGGRDYKDYRYLSTYLNTFHSLIPIDLLINGAQTGADTMSSNWAHENGIALREYPADWNKFGRAAGPIRNALMLEDGKPDEVIAFPGGRGTDNMIKLAKKAGVKVTRAKPDGQ